MYAEHTRNTWYLCRKQTVKTKYNKVPVVRDAGTTEVAVRPMDDVCPWEAVPGPSTEAGGTGDAVSSGRTSSADQARHVWDNGGYATITHSAEAARTSRKNSVGQLDSCSSSSDVSLAIADVSERLRKSCSLQHSGSVGRYNRGQWRDIAWKEYSLFLSTLSSDFETRRYIDFRPRYDNAKLFYLLSERPYQAGWDRSRIRVILQLSVAPTVIRVFPRGGGKSGREIVPGEDRARGRNRRGSHRRQGEPAES